MTVLVDFEQVNGDVRRTEAFDPVERILPGGACLVWQASDKVQVDVADACVMQDLQITTDRIGIMPTPHPAKFIQVERLNTKADSVDAVFHPAPNALGRDGARGAFERYLVELIGRNGIQ